MNKTDKLWYLKNLDIFEGIPEDEMMQLAKKVQESSYNKDELIYSPEEALDSIYVVKRGEVRLYHSKKMVNALSLMCWGQGVSLVEFILKMTKRALTLPKLHIQHVYVSLLKQTS